MKDELNTSIAPAEIIGAISAMAWFALFIYANHHWDGPHGYGFSFLFQLMWWCLYPILVFGLAMAIFFNLKRLRAQIANRFVTSLTLFLWLVTLLIYLSLIFFKREALSFFG